MKVKRLSENQINYNIFNALNLYNENLGELYITNQFNPFDDNFKLTEDFIIEYYTNNLQAKEINEPEFLTGGIIETKAAFENSLHNCNSLLEKVESQLNSTNISLEEKEKLKKLKQYILCRNALLNLYIKTLKKDKKTLKMYASLQGLNWKYGEILDSSYIKQIDIQIVINALMQIQAKQENTNLQLKAKAKEIIAKNLKEYSKQDTNKKEIQQTKNSPSKSLESKAPKSPVKIQTKQNIQQKSFTVSQSKTYIDDGKSL